MLLWRVSNRNDLSGLGGERSDARWHTAARGKRIAYLAEHPAVALIEVLVNLEGDPELFPDSFQLIKVEASENASISALDAGALPANWRDSFAATRAMGDDWLESGRSALLAVPSA